MEAALKIKLTETLKLDLLFTVRCMLTHTDALVINPQDAWAACAQKFKLLQFFSFILVQGFKSVL
jgi:glutathione synthase/RimK-type ligase-like ATP-grasp enzyme